MKILAIDSSGLVASAAVASEDTILGEYTTNFKKTHSETLLPMIDAVLRMTETELATLDAIAVTAGPGSFTGLRIGAATAKGLAQATGIKVISIETTLALAWNLAGSPFLICPLMDARRAQVYTGLYRFSREENTMRTVLPQCVVSVDEIIDTVNERGEQVIFLGDGMSVYEKVLMERVTVPFDLAPIHLVAQRAASVAACAFAFLRNMDDKACGVMQTTAAEFVPVYLRKSQAEREREGKDASATGLLTQEEGLS